MVIGAQTHRTGRKPSLPPGSAYIIEVERWDAAPDTWLQLHRIEGDERITAINLFHNYYVKHWPNRRLRVRGFLTGKVIVEHTPIPKSARADLEL